jgi:hypothetical protein
MPCGTFLSLDEILKGELDISHLLIAAFPKFLGDVLGCVLRPAFGGIEGYDADRIIVLA